MRADVLAAWRSGVAAADGREAVVRALARAELSGWREPDFFIATGKAAAGMADALPKNVNGIILLPRAAPDPPPCAARRVLRADHPVPTPEGMAAAESVLAAARALGGSQRLLYLVSGGTSSLFEVPRAGVEPASLIGIYERLVTSGAAIGEINVVRRAFSAVKGGGLLRATEAEVLTLAMSDVPADDPAVIGSGPTVEVAESARDARVVLERRGLWNGLAPDLRAVLESPALGSPRRGRSAGFHIVSSAADAVRAASAELTRRGYALSSPPLPALSGDALAAADMVAETILRERERPGRWGLVAGGETTLAVPTGAGHGGRNQHLAAAVAARLAGVGGFALLCGGTDGIDGTGVFAGGLVDGGSAGRAEAAGLGLEHALASFATTTALEAAGDVLHTGATGTNVGDLLVAACTSR